MQREVADMRIKLIIATGDCDHAEHLSDMLSEHYADTIEVSICRARDRLRELLTTARFDAAFLEPSWTAGMDLSPVHLPILLVSEDDDETGVSPDFVRLIKYQRVSSLVASLFEHYAKVSADGRDPDERNARVTAVWSPAGGVGKTTVAMAYAAKMALEGKQVTYLNLEEFSSGPVYFSEAGRSISAVFEMLENREGNVKTLIRGIRKQDIESGVAYFCRPDNYDDMNILSVENISALLSACSGVTDELVIDMACTCDERSREIFELSDRVFLVTDPAGTSQAKILQFILQHNVFTRIRAKTVLIANKAAAPGGLPVESVIRLPHIQSLDASAVYKALSGNSFESQVNKT